MWLFDSVLAPNSPTLYTPSGTPAHKYFRWPGPRLGTESGLCEFEPPLLVAAFSSGFVRRLAVPSWLWNDFTAPAAPATPPEIAYCTRQ
jgi:hypothetical protein